MDKEEPLTEQHNTRFVTLHETEEGPTLVIETPEQRAALYELLIQELQAAASDNRSISRRHAAPEATPFYKDLVVQAVFDLLLYGSLNTHIWHRQIMQRYPTYAMFEAVITRLIALLQLSK